MKDGGPAFPATRYWNEKELGYRYSSECGMSLRDWFAGMALQGIMASTYVWTDIAKEAYKQADAMLQQRDK